MTCERTREKHGPADLTLITLLTSLSQRSRERLAEFSYDSKATAITVRGGFHPKLSTKENIKEEIAIFYLLKKAFFFIMSFKM